MQIRRFRKTPNSEISWEPGEMYESIVGSSCVYPHEGFYAQLKERQEYVRMKEGNDQREKNLLYDEFPKWKERGNRGKEKGTGLVVSIRFVFEPSVRGIKG